MAHRESFVDGANNPDIQTQVAEMVAAYERRLAAGQRIAEIIATGGREASVGFAAYFAFMDQHSLEEARGEKLRKVGYYSEMFNGLSADDVGEPVLITSIGMLQRMGRIGSFTEEPNPVRYVVGADHEGNRWGRIELAFRELWIPQTYVDKPTFSDTTVPVAIADQTAHRRTDGENIVTDSAFRTKLYIGRQGLQEWVDTKLGNVGDKAVAPLMEALEVKTGSTPTP